MNRPGIFARKKETLALLAFMVFKFVFQFLLTDPVYELHRDEFLHLDQGKHLAWGYLSVPPVTSWQSWFILQMGGSEFWVRFFPALFGAMTLWIVWKAAQFLGGNFFALILSAFCITFSVLLRLNGLFQPNSLDVLCWTVLFYFFIRYAQSEKRKWLYYSALVFAVGFLNKYNILFQIAGIAIGLLISRERRIFTKPTLYIASAIALLLISPNIIWQIQHGFPVIHHMEELARTQLSNVSRYTFLKTQLLFFLGGILVLLAGFWSLIFYFPFRKYRFLLWSFVVTMGLFLLMRAKDYYAIGLYPIFLAFGSVYISRFAVGRFKVPMQIAFLLIPILIFIPMYRVAFPNKTPSEIIENPDAYRELGMLRWEDGKQHHIPQDFADMIGWEELASKVDSVYLASPDKASTLVLCDNYGQAGAINFYSKHGIKAVSFNADYVNWFDLQKRYNHLIRIKEKNAASEEIVETAPFFKNARISASVKNPYAREKGTTVFFFSDARIDITPRIRQEIQKEKW